MIYIKYVKLIFKHGEQVYCFNFEDTNHQYPPGWQVTSTSSLKSPQSSYPSQKTVFGTQIPDLQGDSPAEHSGSTAVENNKHIVYKDVSRVFSYFFYIVHNKLSS